MKTEAQYSPEYGAAVEERAGKPMIMVEVKQKKNQQGEMQEVCVIDIAGVKIESLASREDIEAVIKEIRLTADALKLLQNMALCYQQKRGLIVEGDTSIGKTFLLTKFVELMFGKGRKPIDFYCNGQTDTMALMAKWVPKTDDPADQEKWGKYVNSAAGRKAMQKIIDNVEAGRTKPKDIQDQFIEIAEQAGVNQRTSQWQFQFGALPRAMTMPKDPAKPVSDDNPSLGTVLHIQEVGLAETHVIDTLLQLGGEKGKLAGEIQLWEDGGRTVESGPNFWIYYSTNPPEKYPDRHGLDQALARRNTFINIGKGSPVSREVHRNIIGKVAPEDFLDELKEKLAGELKQEIIPMEFGSRYESREYLPVRRLVVEAAHDFFEKLSIDMETNSVLIRPKQKFVLTDDEFSMVIDYIIRFQTPDMEATLDKAMFLHVIDRFQDKGKEHAWNLWQEVKKNKKFREKLEQVMPKDEDVLKALEELQALAVFKEQIEADLAEIEQSIENYCEVGNG